MNTAPLVRLLRRAARSGSGLDRYLIPNEVEVLRTRRHVLVLIRPTLVLLGSIVLSAAAGGAGPEADRLLSLIVLGALLYLMYHLAQWFNDELIVTDRRILEMSGLITRKVASMPLRKVTDLTYQQSLTGRAVGYGTFIVESAGQDQALSRLEPIPRSDHFYRTVTTYVFSQPRQY